MNGLSTLGVIVAALVGGLLFLTIGSILGAFFGGLAGVIVGFVFDESVVPVVNYLLPGFTMWQVGAFLGFVSMFFRSPNVKADK